VTRAIAEACKALKQQLINQLMGSFLNRLPSCVLNKLSSAVLTSESWFAVMSMAVFNNLRGLAFGTVHNIVCNT
jgi:hypothetical protein